MKDVRSIIKKLLAESKVDDIKKKYNVDPVLVNRLSREDPSGKNKYLEWMVKAMMHEPTVISLNALNGVTSNEVTNKTVTKLIDIITKFHDLLPYMVTVEDGKKVGTTDINAYKFKDGEMILYLVYDITQATDRRHKKKEKELLKKQVNKIFLDKNWLLLEPKTHQASCFYGAGTRWCTTAKDTTSHFERETSGNFLIYAINKNLPVVNDLHKVAWQIHHMVRKETLKNVLLNNKLDKSTSLLKFYDTQDNRMSTEQMKDYLSTVPEDVKMAVYNYVVDSTIKMYGEIDIENTNEEAVALAAHLEVNPNEVVLIDVNYFYSFSKYATPEGDYLIATYDSAYNDLESFLSSYVDDSIGIREAVDNMGDSIASYISIPDAHIIALEMASSAVSDMSDDDVIDNLNSSMDSYNTYHSIMLEKSDIEQKIDDLLVDYNAGTISEEDYDEKLNELQEELGIIDDRIERVIEEARDELEVSLTEEEEYRIERDPYEWLREMGYVTRHGSLTREAFSLVDIDEEGVNEYYTEGLYFDSLSPNGDYEEFMYDGVSYVVMTD